jgi:anti-sigma regulatory factor (Ser/Thr protein kinase)
VGSFLADVRAPVEVSQEILLAVGEAAANAARHGRRPEGRSELRVRCLLEGPAVEVTVADDGPGFDSVALASTSLPDRFASGGRGIFLMEQLTDNLDVSSSERGTTVVLNRRVFE